MLLSIDADILLWLKKRTETCQITWFRHPALNMKP